MKRPYSIYFLALSIRGYHAIAILYPEKRKIIDTATDFIKIIAGIFMSFPDTEISIVRNSVTDNNHIPAGIIEPKYISFLLTGIKNMNRVVQNHSSDTMLRSINRRMNILQICNIKCLQNPGCYHY